MASQNPASTFVPLPIRHGDAVRLRGPRPEEAATVVEPLTPLDAPIGVVQSFLGGVCDPDGRLIRPLEVVLLLDAATVPPGEVVPLPALVESLRAWPRILAGLPRDTEDELICSVLARSSPLAPLLYCRKRHVLFEARSPHTTEPLRAVEADGSVESGPELLPLPLLSWDGPTPDGRTPAIYGGRAGHSAVGSVSSFEQLILDQGEVVKRAAALQSRDAQSFARLAAAHPCCTCSERTRCYPGGAGYSYAADRLVVVNAGAAPLVVLPWGEWQLDETYAMLGGRPPSELVQAGTCAVPELDEYRRRQVAAMEASGPFLLLAGESDGRPLLEIARLKLGLLADVLEQLDDLWRAGERPHLCWGPQTIRASWRAAPRLAAGWGFAAVLRRRGLAAFAPVETPDGRPLPYPPVFSDESLLAPEVVDAARHFGQPRKCTLFVKSAEIKGRQARVSVLLEDLNIPWPAMCTGDVAHVDGEGWQAVLSPAAQRNPDDGEGLPMSGRAVGNVAGMKQAAQFDGCTCRWYPRFGEAVDLHAFGVLLLETLLATDERPGPRLRQTLNEERDELTRLCLGLEVEQREPRARAWVAQRCDADSPSAVWTRRNLLYRRADRAATRLDALPPALWHAIVTFGLRLSTAIPGFSFCENRAAAAPRLEGGLLAPLVELRGLVALLDDRMLGRTAADEALRAALG